MNELVIIGKTVSTHGIKGELKVVSNFDYKDRAFVVGNTILINNIEHTITSIRYHKQYILLGIDNIDNINNVLEYVGYNIYLAKGDLYLNDDEYLLNDLIDMDVYDNNELIGKVVEIITGNGNNLFRLDNNTLIPIVNEYVIKVDKNNRIIKCKNTKELMF